MKKLLLFIILLAGVKAFAQDAAPTSPKTVGNAQLFYSITGGDTSVFLKTGMGAGKDWAKLLRYNQALTYFDSLTFKGDGTFGNKLGIKTSAPATAFNNFVLALTSDGHITTGLGINYSASTGIYTFNHKIFADGGLQLNPSIGVGTGFVKVDVSGNTLEDTTSYLPFYTAAGYRVVKGLPLKIYPQVSLYNTPIYPTKWPDSLLVKNGKVINAYPYWNFYNHSDTLTSNRTVTMGSDSIVFNYLNSPVSSHVGIGKFPYINSFTAGGANSITTWYPSQVLTTYDNGSNNPTDTLSIGYDIAFHSWQRSNSGYTGFDFGVDYNGIRVSDQNSFIGLYADASIDTANMNNSHVYVTSDWVLGRLHTLPSGATGANPTASAGVSPVNGSAPTYMRSDGAPKIDTSHNSNGFATYNLLSTYLPKASIVSTYQTLANLQTTLDNSTTHYPSTSAVYPLIGAKQPRIIGSTPTPTGTTYTAADSVSQALANISNRQSLDSALFIKRVIGAIHQTTIAQMQAYTGSVRSIIVTATDGTGGLFNYVASGLTADGGVVITATGVGSGFWVRQFDASKGVCAAWWGDTAPAIQLALNYVGAKGVVNLTPGKTYAQSAELDLTGDRQIIYGNSATIQRQTETVATISGTVLSSANSFTVSSVPSTWHVSDVIQLFVSQSTTGASPLLFIAGISGNVITVSGTVGAALGNGSTSYASPSVYKVWNQINDANNYNFEIHDVIFDGNSSTSAPNVYWATNNAIYAATTNSLITRCSFINMPSNGVYGQGLKVINNYFHNINDAAIHLSADYTHVPALYPYVVSENKMIRCNQVLSSTGSGHSEGVITFSFTSGYGHIHHNWVDSSLNSFVGTIQMGASTTSGATRLMTVDANIVRNVQLGPIAGFVADATEIIKPGKIIFTNNTFDNCGTTTPFPATLNATWAFIDKVVWFDNLLTGGTAVTVPAEVYTTDAIANVGATANIQTGTSYNIDGNGTMGGNLAVTGTSLLTGNVRIGGSANTAISFGNHKNITGGVAAYANYSDGTIQSDVTTSAYMNYSRPSMAAASFTLTSLYHNYLYGFNTGAGSAVTTQYGYYVESTFTGATTNYGFYGNIAAASGRWNLAMFGSAQNGIAGKTFIGPSVVSPTAYLHLGAGTATAGTAPIKLTTGTLLTTPEAGAIEYVSPNLYYTDGTPTRHTIAALDLAQAFTNKDFTGAGNTFPNFNQNTTGTAANLSGTPALPNGTTATTQSAGDNSTKIATTAYVATATTITGTRFIAPFGLLDAPSSTVNDALSVNQIIAVQFYLPFTIVVNSLKANVTTSAAASNIYLGIYNASFTKIVSTSAIVSTSTGLKSGTVSTTTLSPGFYWAAYGSDNTAVRVTGYLNNGSGFWGTSVSGSAANSISGSAMPSSLGSISGLAGNNPAMVMISN